MLVEILILILQEWVSQNLLQSKAIYRIWIKHAHDQVQSIWVDILNVHKYYFFFIFFSLRLILLVKRFSNYHVVQSDAQAIYVHFCWVEFAHISIFISYKFGRCISLDSTSYFKWDIVTHLICKTYCKAWVNQFRNSLLVNANCIFIHI